MFLKTLFLNLKTKLSNRSLVLLLGLSLLHHTPVFTRIKPRQIFLKRRCFSHLYYLDELTISFSFGRMEKQNLKSIWRDLLTFCRTINLHTSHRKNASLENGSVTTDLHTESTDCHQYLHCSFSHPDHIKSSIIYSQTLRLRNICTYKEDFDKYALNMKS